MLITRLLLVQEIWDNLQEIMNWESSGMVGFDLEPLLPGQMRIDKLKSAYNSLNIGPGGLEIMGWESSGVVGFDLGLKQG